MRTLGVLFYTTVLILMGIAFIALAVVFSFDQAQPQCIKYLNDFLTYLQASLNARILIGLSGVVLILISFSFTQLILARFQQEKHIAFPTASGEVTIALSAVEDLIRRIASILPEIRELRPDVRAVKKDTILVEVRVVLGSEANIPELTSRLQDLVKAKIQEVIGIEGQIVIKIHVAKIIAPEERDRKRRDGSERQEPPIPFGGYARV